MCGICGIFYSQSGIFRTLRLWDQKGLDRDAHMALWPNLVRYRCAAPEFWVQIPAAP